MSEQLDEPMMSLQQYVRGQDAERAFERLAGYFSGLIYSSAYRSLGNAALAEDVTQAVLLVLAKKASSLVGHPALSAWVFKTTRMETLNTKRKEKRRAQKYEAFQQELGASAGEVEGRDWEAALPLLDKSLERLPERDRDLVLQRFFERRKFRDIAERRGTSEAAVKMGLKRALEKMSSWMTRKGVTMSIVGLGTVLSSELAKAAPLALGKFTLDSGVVPHSGIFSSFGGGSLPLTGALVLLAVTAVPATMIWDDIQELEKRLIRNAAGFELERSGRRLSESRRRTPKDAVAALSEEDLQGLSMEELAYEIAMAEECLDQIRLHQIELMLGQLDIEDLRDLGVATNRSRLTRLERVAVMRKIVCFYPSGWSCRERVEFAISVNAPRQIPFRDFQDWCQESLAEAGHWLKELSGSKFLRGSIGSSNYHYEGAFWQVYLDALARESPTEVLAYLDRFDGMERRAMVGSIADSVVRLDLNLAIKTALESDREGGRNEWVEAIVDDGFSRSQRERLKQTMGELGFADSDLSTSAHRLFREMERKRNGPDFLGRMKWLEDNLPSRESGIHISFEDVVNVHETRRLKPGVRKWLDLAPAGDRKDRVLQAVVSGLVFVDQYGGDNGPEKIVRFLVEIQSRDLRERMRSAFMEQGPKAKRIDQAVLLKILREHGISSEEKGDVQK